MSRRRRRQSVGSSNLFWKLIKYCRVGLPLRAGMAANSSPVDPTSFYPSPRTEARRSLDGFSQVSSPMPHLTQRNDTEQPLTQEATTASLAPAESVITESEAEPIYIDGDAMPEGNIDDTSSDEVVLTDEEDTPQIGLPLPMEHIYVQDPRQPLLLSDFQVLKTLGKPLADLLSQHRHDKPRPAQALVLLAVSCSSDLHQTRHITVPTPFSTLL
jgi:hypothetical protein